MPMDGGHPNYFTINGKAYPATDTIRMRVGERLEQRVHPPDAHPRRPVPGRRTRWRNAAGFCPLSSRHDQRRAGQHYDVIWKAQRLGKWLIHCQIGHHTTNNNVETKGAGGLMMVIDVRPA